MSTSWRAVIVATAFGCGSATAPAGDPTSALVLRPAALVFTVAAAQANGLSAMLINRQADTITVLPTGCRGSLAALDAWIDGGWRELILPTFAPCPLAAHPISIFALTKVAPGDSVPVTPDMVPPQAGWYRLRVQTSAGEARSPTIEVTK